MSTYGLDLREVLWGENPAGVRRTLSLVRGLPKDSALARAVNKQEGWTQEDELLATIADGIAVGNYLFTRANSKQGARIPEPTRFPRPWEEKEGSKREPSSPEAVHAFFTDPEFGFVLWDAHGAEESS